MLWRPVGFQHMDPRRAETFWLSSRAGRGLRTDPKVKSLVDGSPELEQIVRPLLATLRQLREPDCRVRQGSLQQVRADPIVRLVPVHKWIVFQRHRYLMAG